MMEGHIAERVVGGKLLAVHRITFGRARLTVERLPSRLSYDDAW